ncbi:MAG TPA: hypothetical protein VGI06_14420 [Acidimicrobiales bacterium]|jgi:hypothetical protein
MDFRVAVELPCAQERAHAELAALDRYPDWLSIVQEVATAPADPADPGPAWWVGVGARVGPLRRTKRVRMVRTVDEPARVLFARREVDGSAHGPWLLAVELESRPGSPAATFTMVSLHYGGSAWLPLLDAVLAREARAAAARLRARVADLE